MPQKIRMWEVTPDQKLTEITSQPIPLEERLEDWLESDISMLDEDLLVIGRQVRTDFGVVIDLLCLDSSGNTVVIELKKGKTPREVVAQALDYASWTKDLTYDQILEIANNYFGPKGNSLAEAFSAAFDGELPDTLNLGHRSIIVAEAMDASTERIVRYLSDLHVPINVATVQHFKAGGREMLAQVYLVEPEIAKTKSRPSSGGRGRRSLTDLQGLADDNGVGNLYRRLEEGVSGIFDARGTSSNRENYVRYRAQLGERRTRTLLYVYAETDEDGGLPFDLQATWLSNYLGISFEELEGWLPENTSQTDASKWVGSDREERIGARGLKGYFHTEEEVDRFLEGLRASTP